MVFVAVIAFILYEARCNVHLTEIYAFLQRSGAARLFAYGRVGQTRSLRDLVCFLCLGLAIKVVAGVGRYQGDL